MLQTFLVIVGGSIYPTQKAKHYLDYGGAIEMSITIRVPWTDPMNHGDAWNELLAWTVETYGLPGEKVSFHPRHDWMDLTFEDEQDALMFQIKTGGYVRRPEDYTAEFIGVRLNGH